MQNHTNEKLIQSHGGYKTLKSFQIARLVFDITVRFCNKFIGMRSRTHDQMVQAARSGVQNIAEGSLASATSKKTELKLTNVARASLEELKLDYQDFLRQRNLEIWVEDAMLAKDLIRRRLSTADEFALWAKRVSESQSQEISQVAANGVLVLIRVACSLLKKQIEAQATAFQEDGGFTERLYRIRSQSR